VNRALGTGGVAEALRSAGCAVEIHDKHFPQAAKDTEWLLEVGRRGWVALTKDHHIRTRQNELVALLSAGVAAFVLTSGDVTGPEMAQAFVRALPKVRWMVVGEPRPFIARVSAGGGVILIFRGMPRWLRRRLERERRGRKGVGGS
jgi:hypothetical protein